MPTGLASLVLQTSAPFTVILGVVLLRERMSLLQVLGIGVAVAGMVAIAVDRVRGEGLGGNALAVLVPMLLTVIGGYLSHAASLTAFGNTVPVSFLRLVPHQEAPTSPWSPEPDSEPPRARRAIVVIPVVLPAAVKQPRCGDCSTRGRWPSATSGVTHR